MNYNIHPIIVHFPIAFLFIYSFIKIVPFSKWFPEVSWKHIERSLLLIGVLGAFAALSTGEIAEQLVNPNHQLVEMHSTFADISVWIYGILLLGEIISIINQNYISHFLQYTKVVKFLAQIEKLISNNILSKILAFFGFIAIFVTGLLGGVMVFGLSADPIAKFVLIILGINI